MRQTIASTPAASAHRCLPGRAARVMWLVWLSLCLAGCVVIPYQPEPETQHELAEVPRPELIRLRAGPRQFLAEMSEEIRKADARVESVDGQAFLDAAAPDGELTLSDVVRVVLLASEAIRTAEDIAAAERAARQTRTFYPIGIDAYPGSSEPAPLGRMKG
jgi:hypothetical protein